MSFILAKLSGTKLPRIVEHPVAAGEEFFKGAPLVLEDGEYREVDDLTEDDIFAIAISDYGIDPAGFSPLGVHEFPPGLMQGVQALFSFFRGEFVGPLPEEVGGDYGIIRGADGRWRVNFADSTPIVRYIRPVRDEPEYPIPAGGAGVDVTQVVVQFLPNVVDIV